MFAGPHMQTHTKEARPAPGWAASTATLPPCIYLRLHLPQLCPPCCAAGLELEGAFWVLLGEDRFSKGLGLLKHQRWQPQLSTQDPTAVRVVSRTRSGRILLLAAPSHPLLFRASHAP